MKHIPPGATAKVGDTYYKRQNVFGTGQDRYLKWERTTFAWTWVPCTDFETEMVRRAITA